MIWLYRLCLFPVFLVLIPRFINHAIKREKYLENFSERWGCYPRLPQKQKPRVWVQAVSLGEMKSIRNIVSGLAAEHEVIITTTTRTGYECAQAQYKDSTVGIHYFPFDFLPSVSKAYQAFDPDLVLLVDSELWPEHLHQAKQRNIPVILSNGRISDKSFVRYSRYPWYAQWMMSSISTVNACSDLDYQRFKNFIKPGVSLNMTGNLKLDSAMEPMSEEDKAKWKEELGFGDKLILLGSSTWDGEEQLLLDVYQEAKAQGVYCHLLLVPRHKERGDAIEALLKESGLRYQRRSHQKQAEYGCEVYLADSSGELGKLTQLADIALIGKSFEPHLGGQSPVDVAATGIPMVYGPKMSNFTQICQKLESEYGSLKAKDHNEAKAQLHNLLANPESGNVFGRNARQWFESNLGAADRNLAIIKGQLRGQ